jgi:hypothetical protein
MNGFDGILGELRRIKDNDDYDLTARLVDPCA